MLNSLGFILGIKPKLAMNIFGGKTEFRKMISLDGKERLIKKLEKEITLPNTTQN